eukprot:358092-Chlamydomonas_euryale.AAC.1
MPSGFIESLCQTFPRPGLCPFPHNSGNTAQNRAQTFALSVCHGPAPHLMLPSSLAALQGGILPAPPWACGRGSRAGRRRPVAGWRAGTSRLAAAGTPNHSAERGPTFDPRPATALPATP